MKVWYPGTVRTSKTQGELIEEDAGTTAQKQTLVKEKNHGLNKSLSALKLEQNTQLEWDKLYGCLSEDGKVLEYAWKDQNVVLFMTTVSNGRRQVVRELSRSAKTATNARTSRAVFGSSAVKELSIPKLIDMYNRFMSGVDQADQLRSYYSTQPTPNKNWRSLWPYLFDTTFTNAYKIAYCTDIRPFGEPWQHNFHKLFRNEL